MSIQQIKTQKQLLQQLVSTLQREIQSKNQQQSIIINELQHLVKENENINQRYSQVVGENRVLVERDRQQRRMIGDLQQVVGEMHCQLRFCNQQLGKLNSQLIVLRGQLQEIQRVKNSLQQQNIQLSQQFAHQYSQQLNELRETNSRLTKVIEELHQFRHQSPRSVHYSQFKQINHQPYNSEQNNSKTPQFPQISSTQLLIPPKNLDPIEQNVNNNTNQMMLLIESENNTNNQTQQPDQQQKIAIIEPERQSSQQRQNYQQSLQKYQQPPQQKKLQSQPQLQPHSSTEQPNNSSPQIDLQLFQLLQSQYTQLHQQFQKYKLVQTCQLETLQKQIKQKNEQLINLNKTITNLTNLFSWQKHDQHQNNCSKQLQEQQQQGQQQWQQQDISLNSQQQQVNNVVQIDRSQQLQVQNNHSSQQVPPALPLSSLPLLPQETGINYLRNSFSNLGLDIDFTTIAKHIGLEVPSIAEEQQQIEDNGDRQHDDVVVNQEIKEQQQQVYSFSDRNCYDKLTIDQLMGDNSNNSSNKRMLSSCMSQGAGIDSNNNQLLQYQQQRQPQLSPRRIQPVFLKLPGDEQQMRSSYDSNSQFAQIVIYYQEQLGKLREELIQLKDKLKNQSAGESLSKQLIESLQQQQLQQSQQKQLSVSQQQHVLLPQQQQQQLPSQQQSRYQQLLQQQQQHEQKVSQLSQQLTKLQQQLNTLRQQNQQLLKINSQLFEQHALEQQEKINVLQAQLSRKYEHELDNKLEQLLNKMQEDKREQLQQLNNQKQLLSHEINSLTQQNAALTSQLSNHQQLIQQLSLTHQKTIQQKQQKQLLLKQNSKLLKQANQRLEQLRDENQQLSRQLQRLMKISQQYQLLKTNYQLLLTKCSQLQQEIKANIRQQQPTLLGNNQYPQQSLSASQLSILKKQQRISDMLQSQTPNIGGNMMINTNLQNFSINNISNIHAIVDQLTTEEEDNFILLQQKQRQISLLKCTIDSLTQQVSQLNDDLKQRQFYITQKQHQLNSIDNSYNSQIMMLKKSNAELQSQLIKLKKQVFSYQKDNCGDLGRFIQQSLGLLPKDEGRGANSNSNESYYQGHQQQRQQSIINNNPLLQQFFCKFSNYNYPNSKFPSSNNNSQTDNLTNLTQQFIPSAYNNWQDLSSLSMRKNAGSSNRADLTQYVYYGQSNNLVCENNQEEQVDGGGNNNSKSLNMGEMFMGRNVKQRRAKSFYTQKFSSLAEIFRANNSNNHANYTNNYNLYQYDKYQLKSKHPSQHYSSINVSKPILSKQSNNILPQFKKLLEEVQY